MIKEEKIELALFRYGLIHPLLGESLPYKEKAALRKQILSKTHEMPNSCRTTINERTLRKYVQWYREGGFSGLMRCTRKDNGNVRAIPEEVLEKAFAFKDDLPTRSIREIIQMLELSGEAESGSVKNSTLSRAMSQRNGGLRGPSTAPVKTFHRFEKETVNDTWQSDVKHCIYLPDPANPKEYLKTYLIAFLDDKSRRVCGKIYWAENGANVEDCFRKTLLVMGIPQNFYTDNAQIFRTKRLQIICAELGSKLKYCRPYSPQSKGKLEKFNSYVDRSFEPEARRLGIKTLEELNQYFNYWLSENYNNKIHGETRKTPYDAHECEKKNIRHVSLDEIKRIFIQRQVRKVNKAATVSLGANLYRVEGFLSRKEVELRYDPKDMSRIEVYCNGQQYKDAEPLVIRANVWDGETDTKNDAHGNEPPIEKEVQTSFLKLLKEKHEQGFKDKAHRINYAKLYDEEGDGHV